MNAESLLALAASIAGEHNFRQVLTGIVQGLTKEPGVAIARIWLLAPGDICSECFLRSECPNQTECLHLVASAGVPLETRADWSSLEGESRRIPLNNRQVAVVATSGKSMHIAEITEETGWVSRPKWAPVEKIRSFVGHPLVVRGQVLGVLAVFSRDSLQEQDSVWLRMFADQAAVAITNAQAFEVLERSQALEQKHSRELKQVLDVVPQHMFVWEPDGNASYGNRAAHDYFGPIPPKRPMEFLDLVTHPDDVEGLKDGIRRQIGIGEPFEMEARLRRHDGEYRWFLYHLRPLRDDTGKITRWCGTRTDIEDRRRATIQAQREFLALREHVNELQQVMDVVPYHMYILQPDASIAFWNRAADEYFRTPDPPPPKEWLFQVIHPDEVEKLWAEFENAGRTGKPAEMEARMRGVAGQYRWFLHQIFPLKDEAGKITRWVGARIDIDDQKRMQDRTQRENLALREEIDKVSMFEEIVGTSPALQVLLGRVSKVAPSDSTVLITGETGTGKELIARAIHKRSPRASRAFVSVNCAAIPRDLIASELFGHEKGAFTGALQRRLGRFELAEGGTIFLDEIGELTAEIQVALLRVLQEREFDRVGGSRPIRADVRVIAATHRDLPAAIAAGTFRSDLYYRINVFPVEVPPLRERKEDIRLLVEYFIDRYSSKLGKKITSIDKRSMAHLQSYSWPGNIRELQNVIERSVIVSDPEAFSVDESWLSHKPVSTRPLMDDLEVQERERIEAALAEAKGRISGDRGAATKLGMPASTLDSKIKSLKIDKRRFQTG